MKVSIDVFKQTQDALPAPDAAYTAKESSLIFYPQVELTTKEQRAAVAHVTRVTDGKKEHTVVVTYQQGANGEESISVWCGDKFLDSRVPQTEADLRVKACVSNTILTGTAATWATQSLLEGHNLFNQSDACNFWTAWRNDKKLCAHTQWVLATLRDNKPTLVEELRAKFLTLGAPPVISDEMSEYSLTELAFKVPVLIEGDRGSGKTFEARALARNGNFMLVEANGHEGLEATDLLGFLVPVSGHSGLIWKDGPLTKAFRAAQTKKTVLIIDEMLRIRQRELSILLTALTPDRGCYRLTTGRITEVVDGVGTEEILEIPISNLAVVATTNVGGEYAVDACDPALAERFVIIRKDTDIASLIKVLSEVATVRKFSLAVVTKLGTFFTKMVQAKKTGLISNVPTVRTLSRAVELAGDESKVVRGVRSQILLWVARDADGYPVQPQIDAVNTVLDMIFTPSTAS